jgi:hypothetical protein
MARTTPASSARFDWPTVALLLTIGFTPFVTAVLSQNRRWVATSLYVATGVLVSSLLIVM